MLPGSSLSAIWLARHEGVSAASLRRGVVLIFLTGLVRKNKVLPPIIALGYILGFAAGALFGYDYGEGLNNLWIIWLWCFVSIVVVGVVGNLFLQKRSQEKKEVFCGTEGFGKGPKRVQR